MADLVIGRAFVRDADFGVAADLVIRAGVPFLVACAEPFTLGAAADLVIGRAFAELVSFAATPEGRSALAKLPALGAILNPIVERQIADAERSFRER